MRLLTIVRTSLAGFVVTAFFASPARLGATEFSCTGSGCPSTSTCDGDYWEKDGECKIQCYKLSGPKGEIVKSGSASCESV